MAETRTEALHQNAEGLDIQAPDAILSCLANAQIEAALAMAGTAPCTALA
ncbi:MAG: N-acetylmuramic acid 6-phosphate etherase, partial [Mesorhizobium sp.]